MQHKTINVGDTVEILEVPAAIFHGVAGQEATVKTVSRNGPFEDILCVQTEQGSFDCLSNEVRFVRSNGLLQYT